MAKFYRRIKDTREDSDKKQEDVARYLYVDKRQYRRWENGESTIPTEVIAKIADYFQVSIDYLVGRVNGKKKIYSRKSTTKKKIIQERKHNNENNHGTNNNR